MSRTETFTSTRATEQQQRQRRGYPLSQRQSFQALASDWYDYLSVGENGNGDGPAQTVVVRAPRRDPTRRHFIGGTIFILFSALVFFYWAGFPLNNTIYEHGYPSLASELPGPFKSSRYHYEWWLVWILSLNALLPLVLAFSLTDNRVEEYARFHGFLAALLLVANAIVGILLLISWCFRCNTAYSAAATWCNDYRWCCAQFGNGLQETIDRCPNTTPCAPDVMSNALSVNGEYIHHMVFSLVFFLLALAHLGVKDSLSKFGVFTNRDYE